MNAQGRGATQRLDRLARTRRCGQQFEGNVTVDSSMVTSSKTPREKNALWQKKRVK